MSMPRDDLHASDVEEGRHRLEEIAELLYAPRIWTRQVEVGELGDGDQD